METLKKVNGDGEWGLGDGESANKVFMDGDYLHMIRTYVLKCLKKMI